MQTGHVFFDQKSLLNFNQQTNFIYCFRVTRTSRTIFCVAGVVCVCMVFLFVWTSAVIWATNEITRPLVRGDFHPHSDRVCNITSLHKIWEQSGCKINRRCGSIRRSILLSKKPLGLNPKARWIIKVFFPMGSQFAIGIYDSTADLHRNFTWIKIKYSILCITCVKGSFSHEFNESSV